MLCTCYVISWKPSLMLQSCHYSDLCSPQLPPRTTFHFNIISCCVQFVCLNGWYQFIVKYIHTTWHGVIGPWSGETTHNTCIEIKQNNKRTTIRTTCMHRKNNGRTKKEPTTHSPQKTTTKANDTTTTYPGLASAPSPFTSNVAYTLVSGILSLPAALNMTSSLYIHDLWAAVSFCGSLPMTKRSPMAPEP